MACERHPDVVETRRCTSCAKVWCDPCARPVGLSAHVICPECGHELRAFVWNLYWIAQACLVDSFIRQNAAAFGWD